MIGGLVFGCGVRLASVKMSVEDRRLAERRPPSPLLTVKSLDISSILLNSPTAMDPLDSPWGGMHTFSITHCLLSLTALDVPSRSSSHSNLSKVAETEQSGKQSKPIIGLPLTI